MTDGIKETPRGEQQPIREVEVGEWFNPFGEDDSSPLATDSETTIPFELNGIGRFEASARNGKNQLGSQKKAVIVILPDRDQVLSHEDFRKLDVPTAALSIRPLEERYEIDFYRHHVESVPYDVEVRSPNGNTYTASFDAFYTRVGTNRGSQVAEEFGTNRSQIIAQETESVLGKIEMRIIPKAGER